MIRTSRLLAIVAVSAAATGCATFSDNSLAARVGDVELSHDELSERLDGAERADGTVARAEIDEFIRRTLADDAGLFDQYGSGELAVRCVYAVQVADRAQADDALGRVAAGEAWDDVVESIAPGATENSKVPCGPLAQYPPETIEPLESLTVDHPTAVIDTPDAVIIVRAQTVDELDILEFLTAISSADPLVLEDFVTAFQEGDIYVDPRFGDFDPTRFTVVPLG